MTRSQSENWSIARSLAFLAATFAIVIGTLLPFAALAAAVPGQPVVICSAEGPQTIQTGGVDGPISKHVGARCAACVMPLLAALPEPPAPTPAPAVRMVAPVAYTPFRVSSPPPARVPPRPPSTAPPHA